MVCLGEYEYLRINEKMGKYLKISDNNVTETLSKIYFKFFIFRIKKYKLLITLIQKCSQ